MTANTMVPPNMTTFQFIVLSVTGIATGKNTKTQTTSKNTRAPRLMKMPKRPRDQRLGGSGGPRRRLRIKVMKDIMYVPSRAETAREPIALNATVEPMLISDSRVVMMKVSRTALRGIFQPGLTCKDPVSVYELDKE